MRRTITPTEWRAALKHGTAYTSADGTRWLLEWSSRGTALTPIAIGAPSASGRN